MCKCNLCKLGSKLTGLVKKYNMDKEDAAFLENDIFGTIEFLGMELKNLTIKHE